jgi:hypothetical protein
MIPSTNPNTSLTPRDLIERAASGEGGAVAAVRKGLGSILVDNALRDFLRPPVSAAVQRYWKARRREIRKHVTADEAVEDVISNVILEIHRNPSLLADGCLAGYAWQSAKNYVIDVHRWEKRRKDALGQRSPMTVAELRGAVMESYVERREEAAHLLGRVLRVLGPARFRALFIHTHFGSHASKEEGVTNGQLANSRRQVRKVMAGDADNKR